MDIGNRGGVSYFSGSLGNAINFSNNSYYGSTGLGSYVYKQTASSAQLQIDGNGAFKFFGVGSGAGGSTFTYSTRMTLDENGRLGINRTPTAYRLEVDGDGYIVNGALGVNVTPNATDGRIDASNDIVAFSSDRRLKTSIQLIDSPLKKIQSLSGFTYNWNNLANRLVGYDTASRYVGVYAQDVQAVLPEAVKLAPFDNDGTDSSISGENYLTVQYEKIVPLLIEAIKELKAEIEELKQGKCE
jgi:hypothetical protein